MEWLNYHHLLYFWMTVREGGISAAAAKLRLAHPTVSGQLKVLEDALGEKLLVRQGRRLVPTEVGRVVYSYADEIFTLGRELLDTVRGRPTGRPVRLVVGIAEVVPKLVARAVLDPALHGATPVRIVCREDKPARLLADLAAHDLDLLLTDAPLPAGSSVRAYSHLLGETGLTFFAARRLAATLRRDFPRSLHGAPLLLPGPDTALRRSLDAWFERSAIEPTVVAEFDDPALLEVFGADGIGAFAAPTVVEDAVRRQYAVQVLGRLDEVRERFYAISMERKLQNPAVVAISEAARRSIFGPAPGG